MNRAITIIILYYVVLFGVVGYVIMHRPTNCPLVKHGCDCASICTRTFDCVRGQHQ